MPLNLSFTHILVVGIVALIVLGPERLPGVARSAGKVFREWRRISGGLEAEVRDVFSEFTEPFNEPLNLIRNGVVDEPAPAEASSTEAPGNGTIVVPPLAAAIPALGPGTGLVSPGPSYEPTLPLLAPPPEPDTFVPYSPGPPAGHGT